MIILPTIGNFLALGISLFLLPKKSIICVWIVSCGAKLRTLIADRTVDVVYWTRQTYSVEHLIHC